MLQRRARDWRHWVAILALGSGALAGRAAAAEDEQPRWQLSSSFGYTAGDFDSDGNTRSVDVPVTLTWLGQRAQLALTLPYASVSAPGGTTLIAGVPSQTKKKGKGAGGDDDDDPTEVERSASKHAGPGDATLKARLFALDEGALLPELALVGKLKLPTADDTHGLGTGEYDEGVGIELVRHFGPLITTLDLGYTWLGDPPGSRLKDPLRWEVGLGCPLSDALFGGIAYEQKTALVSGADHPKSLLFSLGYAVSRRYRLNLLLERGLSDGSPSFGLTAGASVRF
jgi:hypothetical protein